MTLKNLFLSKRVYLVFDYVNLPNGPVGSKVDQFGCSSNYISIASLFRPNEDYRLCGQRRGVKLITTYNIVLINFVTASLSDLTAGFSMIFRVISDPTAFVPPSSTTTLAPLPITSTLRFMKNLGLLKKQYTIE